MGGGDDRPGGDTLAAWRATRYCIDDDDVELVLRVDQVSVGFAALLVQQGAASAALLTAFNPGGVVRDATANQAASRQLAARLNAAGLDYLVSRAESAGGWPDERGYAVLDIAFDEACALAVEFNQIGFLFIGADATPRIVLTGAAAEVPAGPSPAGPASG